MHSFLLTPFISSNKQHIIVFLIFPKNGLLWLYLSSIKFIFSEIDNKLYSFLIIKFTPKDSSLLGFGIMEKSSNPI